MASKSSRTVVVIILIGLALGVSAYIVVSGSSPDQTVTRNETVDASGPRLTPHADRLPPGRLLVRSVDGNLPEADGQLFELSSDEGVRQIGKVACNRIHAHPDGTAFCIRVSSNGFDYEGVVLGYKPFRPNVFEIVGVPSRLRVSPDGRYAAYTAFESAGQGYFADTRQFSTRTRIIDIHQRGFYLLEQLDVRRDGSRLRGVDLEFWGVTFGKRGRYYATLATEKDHLLIEGQVGTGRATVIGEHVECPSLSPNGARLAYKRRIARRSNRWRLHVREIDGGHDMPLAETRSIDDQPEWIGNDMISYSDGKDVYVVRADGGGRPVRVARRATSPAWLGP